MKELLNNENYFGTEAQMQYMGASQFKSFLDCPERTMAEINLDYIRPTSKALMMGSYVDAWFSDEMGTFIGEHPELFKKDGSLKADYLQCDKAIARAERSPQFMEFMEGEKQRVMTGTLFDVPFKIKMDVYQEGKRIVDLKYMKDINLVYDQKESTWKTFVDYYHYDIQAYIYQHIEAQNSESGELLPFYLAVITKEEEPDLRLIQIPQWKINGAEALIEHYAPIFQKYKTGELVPPRCERCGYCHKTKEVKVETYADLFEGEE